RWLKRWRGRWPSTRWPEWHVASPPSAEPRRRCLRRTSASYPISARPSTTSCCGDITNGARPRPGRASLRSCAAPAQAQTGTGVCNAEYPDGGDTRVEIADVVREIRRGMIPALIYSDPDVFAAERERLFSTAWVFLAHESEVPDPGDY